MPAKIPETITAINRTRTRLFRFGPGERAGEGTRIGEGEGLGAFQREGLLVGGRELGLVALLGEGGKMVGAWVGTFAAKTRAVQQLVKDSEQIQVLRHLMISKATQHAVTSCVHNPELSEIRNQQVQWQCYINN